ncbi:MAG: DUF4136 domain-containing protein [Caenibius sp.]
MTRTALSALLLGLAALSGCVAPTGPVEVTRFHEPAALDQLGHGTIAVAAAPGGDPASLEIRTYLAAVSRQLGAIGYADGTADSADQVALVRVERSYYKPDRTRGPVSVGVGGATGGGWGSSVGMGLGIDLSGGPKDQVSTELSVQIRNRASDAVLWEGRSHFTVAADSPMADTQLGAAKLAEALFADFPGTSGETVEVK